MKIITLPIGLTWQSPSNDLWRALYPQCPELAERIGREQDIEELERANKYELEEATSEKNRERCALDDVVEDLFRIIASMEAREPRSALPAEEVDTLIASLAEIARRAGAAGGT